MATTEESLTYEAVLEKDGVKVSKSPWGPDDEIGRLNWVTPESHEGDARAARTGAKLFDLSVDYFVGMPSWSAAGDPKYDIWMTHTPQGSVTTTSPAAGPEVHETYRYCGDSIRCTRTAARTSTRSTTSATSAASGTAGPPRRTSGSRHWMNGGAGEVPEHRRARRRARHRRPARRRLPAGRLRDHAATTCEARPKQGVELRPADIVCCASAA